MSLRPRTTQAGANLLYHAMCLEPSLSWTADTASKVSASPILMLYIDLRFLYPLVVVSSSAS